MVIKLDWDKNKYFQMTNNKNTGNIDAKPTNLSRKVSLGCVMSFTKIHIQIQLFTNKKQKFYECTLPMCMSRIFKDVWFD